MRPDSFDWYATHFPTGENWPSRSSKSVWTTGKGFRSPFMGSAHKSKPVVLPGLRNKRKRPSGDQSTGALFCGVANSKLSGFVSVTDFTYRSYTPVRSELKATRL